MFDVSTSSIIDNISIVYIYIQYIFRICSIYFHVGPACSCFPSLCHLCPPLLLSASAASWPLHSFFFCGLCAVVLLLMLAFSHQCGATHPEVFSSSFLFPCIFHIYSYPSFRGEIRRRCHERLGCAAAAEAAQTLGASAGRRGAFWIYYRGDDQIDMASN